MTEPMSARLQAVRSRPPRLCSVPGCSRMAHRVGTRCKRHADGLERHGHPEGRALPRRLWMPWRDEAERFIRERPHHPGIKHATEWLSTIIKEASPPSRVTRRTRAADRFQVYLASMRSNYVDPVRLLATVAAVHAARLVDARLFKTDRAFWFSVASTFLACTPRPPSGRYRRNGRPSTLTPSANLRDHVGRTITTATGVLAERIATELIRRTQTARPLPGQHVPFTDNPTSQEHVP